MKKTIHLFVIVFFFLSCKNTYSQTTYYVTGFCARVFHPEIKQWDEWSNWALIENPATSVIKFYSSGLSIDLDVNNQTINYFGSNFDYSNSTYESFWKWNNYSGIAKQDNVKLGVFKLGIQDQEYDDLENGSVNDSVEISAIIDNYADLERQYGIAGALLHTAEQYQFTFEIIKREIYEKRISEKQQEIVHSDENLKKGVDFLLLNRTKPGVKITNNGLQYKIIKLGKGIKPTLNDKVVIDIKGSLIDGTSVLNFKNEELVSTLIKGLKEGMLLMRQGSEFVFYISPDLAYGMQGADRVPPNSTLIIKVSLESVGKSE